MSERLRRLVAFYLVQGQPVRHTMERRDDVLDGERIYLSGGLLTDGEWYWRCDLAHYVLKYGMTMPESFLENAEANAWTPPHLADDHLAALAKRIRTG